MVNIWKFVYKLVYLISVEIFEFKKLLFKKYFKFERIYILNTSNKTKKRIWNN